MGSAQKPPGAPSEDSSLVIDRWRRKLAPLRSGPQRAPGRRGHLGRSRAWKANRTRPGHLTGRGMDAAREARRVPDTHSPEEKNGSGAREYQRARLDGRVTAPERGTVRETGMDGRAAPTSHARGTRRPPW